MINTQGERPKDLEQRTLQRVKLFWPRRVVVVNDDHRDSLAAWRSIPRRRRRLALAAQHGRSLSRRSWTEDIATLAILGRPLVPEREVGQRATRLAAGEEHGEQQQREGGQIIGGAGNGIRTR